MDTSLTAGMPLEEMIGQVLVVGFDGLTPSDEIVELIKRYHIGNVILFSRNVRDIGQLRALTFRLQMLAKEAGHRYPLIITIDQENGMVQRLGRDSTCFPGNMAIGATDSAYLSQEIAKATAQELKALGVNMNFAPVVDVNNNPANPVIGTRSFGEDPHRVADLACAMVDGYRNSGMICTLKHFPGHGDTSVDSHLALPTLPFGMDRLNAVELVPFQWGVRAGAPVVMTAHIAFPALTGDPTLPATLSPAILQGILRDQLGFKGVVVTDCLEMDAIAKTFGVASASGRALQAGADLVLVSHRFDRQRDSFLAIRSAVEDGSLLLERVHEAAERVLQLKASYLDWRQVTPISLTDAEHSRESGVVKLDKDTEDAVLDVDALRQWVGTEAHRKLRDEGYEQAMTLVRNDAGLLPLRLNPQQRLLIIYPYNDRIWNQASDQLPSLEVLVSSVRARHANTDSMLFHPSSTPIAEVEQAAEKADLVIMVTINANLDPAQAGAVNALLEKGKQVIVVATQNPYDLMVFPELNTYLVTYEYSGPAMEAAARVLFGAIEAQGQLPVSLPGV